MLHYEKRLLGVRDKRILDRDQLVVWTKPLVNKKTIRSKFFIMAPPKQFPSNGAIRIVSNSVTRLYVEAASCSKLIDWRTSVGGPKENIVLLWGLWELAGPAPMCSEDAKSQSLTWRKERPLRPYAFFFKSVNKASERMPAMMQSITVPGLSIDPPPPPDQSECCWEGGISKYIQIQYSVLRTCRISTTLEP